MALELAGMVSDTPEVINQTKTKHTLEFETENLAIEARDFLLTEDGMAMLKSEYSDGELEPQGGELVLSPFYGPSIYWILILIWIRW